MKNINRDTKTIILTTNTEAGIKRQWEQSAQLEEAGFRNVQLMHGHTPDSLDIENRGLPVDLAGKWVSGQLKHKWGTAACALSHLEILRIPQERLPVIVLEDDTFISPNFFKYLDEVEFPEGMSWDICHLSYWNLDLVPQKGEEDLWVADYIFKRKMRTCPGMYSYILNTSFGDRIAPLNNEIDRHLPETEWLKSFVIHHDPYITDPNYVCPSNRIIEDKLNRIRSLRYYKDSKADR